MPRKYIKIKYLHARVPFRQCLIQFMVRKRQIDPILQSQIQFYSKSISYTIDQNIQLVYYQRHLNSLAIYLIAINGDNRVSSIGFIPLNLAQIFSDHKQKLQGLSQQVGYIIYSLQNQPFPEMNHLVNVKISNSQKSNCSDQGEKNINGKGVNIEKSEFAANQEEEGEQVTMNKIITQVKNDKDKELIRSNIQHKPLQQISKSQLADQIQIDQKDTVGITDSYTEYEELQSFFIQILKHKVKNSEYFRMIKDNQDFLEKSINQFATSIV